jgi:hypothetical protein
VKPFLLSFFILGALPLLAQDARTPTAPFIGGLPDMIAYKKTYTYRNAPPPVPATPLTAEQIKAQQFLAGMRAPDPSVIEVVKTGATRKETWQYVNGSTEERWREGSFRFKTSSANPSYVDIFNPDMSSDPRVAAATMDPDDFGELNWVALNFFVREEEKQNVKCFVYQQDGKTAWISEETRLPVAFDSPQMQISYTYSNPPDEPLHLPQQLRDSLTKLEAGWHGH